MTNDKQSGWRQAVNTLVRGNTRGASDAAGTPGLVRPTKPSEQDPASPTDLTATDRAATAGTATAPVTQPVRNRSIRSRLTRGRFNRNRPTTAGSDAADPAIPTEPLIEGFEGLDYEVVQTRRGPGTKGAVLVLVLLLGVAVLVGIRTVDWLRQKLDPPGDPTSEVVVALPPGSSTAGVSELLAENGIIPDATAYEWYIRLRGGPAFQAGDYVFRQNSSVWEALDVLRGGPLQIGQAEQVSLTIPEGLTIGQMATLFDNHKDLQFSGAEFLEVLSTTPVISTVAPPPDNIATQALDPSEGILFGDTYFVTAATTADQLVETMTTQMDAVLAELGFADSFARVGLTPYEVVIVASIVEGEASRPEDRPRLAQVIYNRLDAGMTLGMDATVRYLVGGADVDAIALAIDSPYNTRLNFGLPPTPINSPSRESLHAALNPEPGDWVFVVKTAEDGTLSFSVEYSQFLQDRQVCIELGFCG